MLGLLWLLVKVDADQGCQSLSGADSLAHPNSLAGDDSMRTSQLNVGTSTDVSLKITESDLSQLTASIRAPSGNEEPCLLKRLPNRHIGEHRGTWGCLSGGGLGDGLLNVPSPQGSPSPPRRLVNTW